MQHILISMGYKLTFQPRERISWDNCTGYKYNNQRQASVLTLKKMKAEMIQNGEIDVGELVVLVIYIAVTNRLANGQVARLFTDRITSKARRSHSVHILSKIKYWLLLQQYRVNFGRLIIR